MTRISLTKMHLFTMQGVENTYHGFDQEWYKKKWHRMAGCGPTTASHIIFYVQNTRTSLLPKTDLRSKDDAVGLMDQLWKFVTPSMQGVNKTEMLEDGVLAYARMHGVQLQGKTLLIPKPKEQRPVLSLLATFLLNGISRDIPIAFLNWHQGKLENLDGWHWVTIVEVLWDETRSQLDVVVLDGGEMKTIDLTLWHQTTKLGGGFVSFEMQ